jgi:hypothetical protein
MPTFAQHLPPGMRRVLDALRLKERPGDGLADLPGRKASLIRGHRKVLDFYQEVLATPDMPQAERASIEDRIGRIEAEPAGLDAKYESARPAQSNHQKAA